MNAKATRCESNGCIEAEGIDGIVLLRSTVTHGAMPCTREEFAVFVKRVRDGEFDGIGSEPMPSEPEATA